MGGGGEIVEEEPGTHTLQKRCVCVRWGAAVSTGDGGSSSTTGRRDRGVEGERTGLVWIVEGSVG